MLEIPRPPSPPPPPVLGHPYRMAGPGQPLHLDSRAARLLWSLRGAVSESHQGGKLQGPRVLPASGEPGEPGAPAPGSSRCTCPSCCSRAPGTLSGLWGQRLFFSARTLSDTTLGSGQGHSRSSASSPCISAASLAPTRCWQKGMHQVALLLTSPWRGDALPRPVTPAQKPNSPSPPP